VANFPGILPVSPTGGDIVFPYPGLRILEEMSLHPLYTTCLFFLPPPTHPCMLSFQWKVGDIDSPDVGDASNSFNSKQ